MKNWGLIAASAALYAAVPSTAAFADMFIFSGSSNSQIYFNGFLTATLFNGSFYQATSLTGLVSDPSVSTHSLTATLSFGDGSNGVFELGPSFQDGVGLDIYGLAFATTARTYDIFDGFGGVRSLDTDPAGFMGFDKNGGPGTIFITKFVSTAVPESSIWAMMLAGFGVVGAGMRRRKVTLSYA